MAIETTYGAGGVQTNTSSPGLQIGGGDMDFWREMARRSMANMQQPQQAVSRAPMAGGRGPSGGGSVTRRGVYSKGGGGGGQEAGGHSYVTNIKGGPQVMGGMMRTSFGASPGNTFYGGWDPNGGSDLGPTRFENTPDNSGIPAIEPGMDPVLRARMVNTGLQGLPRR